MGCSLASINSLVCIEKNQNVCKMVAIKHEKSLQYLAWVMRQREKFIKMNLEIIPLAQKAETLIDGCDANTGQHIQLNMTVSAGQSKNKSKVKERGAS